MQKAGECLGPVSCAVKVPGERPSRYNGIAEFVELLALEDYGTPKNMFARGKLTPRLDFESRCKAASSTRTKSSQIFHSMFPKPPFLILRAFHTIRYSMAGNLLWNIRSRVEGEGWVGSGVL